MTPPLIEDLWAGFQALTPHQKRVVFQLYWEGRTEDDIAESHGCSQQAIHGVIVRAQKKLSGGLLSEPQNYPLHVRDEEGSRPKQKVIASERTGLMPSRPHSPSVKFQPDTMYGSPERAETLEAIREIHWYPYIETMPHHQLRQQYMARLNECRAMVAAGACWDEEYIRNAA